MTNYLMLHVKKLESTMKQKEKKLERERERERETESVFVAYSSFFYFRVMVNDLTQ